MTAAAAVQVEAQASSYAFYPPSAYLRAFLRSGGRGEHDRARQDVKRWRDALPDEQRRVSCGRVEVRGDAQLPEGSHAPGLSVEEFLQRMPRRVPVEARYGSDHVRTIGLASMLFAQWDAEFQKTCRYGRTTDAYAREFERLYGERMRGLGLRCSSGALQRYRVRVVNGEALDQRAGRSGRPAQALFDPDVFEACVSLALHPNDLKVRGAYGLYTYGQAEARRRGVAWSGSPATFARRLRERAPHAFRRYGRDAWEHEAHCLPKMRRPYDRYAVGECFCLDGRTDDRPCTVTDWRGAARRVRATIVALVDFRSRRMFVHVAPSESGRATLVLLKKACRACIPKRIETDNGAGFRKAIAGRRLKAEDTEPLRRATEYLGIEVDCKPVRYAWQKWVESAFARIKEACRLDPLFAGGSPAERPADLERRVRADIDALPPFAEVRAQVEQDVAVYNDTPQAALGGQTPNEMWAAHALVVRPADPELLDFLFTVPAGTRKVGRDGVRFGNLLYGWGDEGTYRLQGGTVHLRIDPEDPSYIWLCDARGKPLHIAACSDVIGTTHEQIKAAEQKRGRLRKLAREFAAAHDQFAGDKIADVRRVIYEDRMAEAERRRKTQAPPEPPPVTAKIVEPELAEQVRAVQRRAARTSLRRKMAQRGGERPFATLARNIGQSGAEGEPERISFADVREPEQQQKSTRTTDEVRAYFSGLREDDATDGTSTEPKTTFADYGEGTAAAG